MKVKRIIFTDEAPLPIGPYSQAVMSGNTLYCSGQIAMDNLQDSITVQTHAICKNIINILAAAELRMEDVVKTTCYLADMDDFAAFNEVYSEYFPHKPARSCVAVRQLPKGALVEVEVIAVMDC